ncbi:hypothetical protein CLOM_g2847 [Closterium sp. NIES-68]|nr:hypothetical protein CLOM_g2847 [Closterium sp. NIES-68]GJP74793.1 hypothetical protein CLOP_g5331 [Closterium sp. NIES-67]
MAFNSGTSVRRFLLSAFVLVLLLDVAYGTDCSSFCGKYPDTNCLPQCQTCEASTKPFLCIASFEDQSATHWQCSYACWPRTLLWLGVSLGISLIVLVVFCVLRRNRQQAEAKYAANAPPAGAAYPPPGGYPPAVNV